MFRQLLIVVIKVSLVALLAGCAAMNPVPKHPDVKLVGLRVLPVQSLLERHIAIDLMIMNPNQRDLSVRSIDYTVSIENINLLKGYSDQVPLLKAHQDTPVTLEVSADVLQILRLVEHFSHNGLGEKVNYNFAAAIDFSAWLPTMHVDKKGALPLSTGKAEKK